MELITKDELKRSPEAVMQAMQKAQAASDMVMTIRRQGIQSFLQQKAMSLAQGFVDKMAPKALDTVTGRDE